MEDSESEEINDEMRYAEHKHPSYKPYMYLLRHRCEYTMGFLERGCGQEADKARGVAECLIRLRDHIRVHEIP